MYKRATEWIHLHFYLFKAYVCAIGCAYLVNSQIDQIPNVLWLVLLGTFAVLFQSPIYFKTKHHIQSTLTAMLYSVFLAVGNDWLFVEKSRYHCVITIMAIVGITLIMQFLLDGLFSRWNGSVPPPEDILPPERALYWHKRIFLGCFAFFFLIYFLYFLNIYPGTLSCDTPAQLGQALGVSKFENANPLINTLVISVFVQIGVNLFHNVNIGVALYTLFQFTLAAFTFAYVVASIFKKGLPTFYFVFAILFYGLVPYNIVYATGMWKDTFFAITFLLTITCLWNGVTQKPSALHKIVLIALSLLTSLARNSGWSALLVLGILLFVYGIRRANHARELGSCVLIGVLLSLITAFAIYPRLGVTNSGGVTVGISVPLQQIARVAATSGDIAPYDQELINQIVPVEELAEKYSEGISDPIKWVVAPKGDILKENMGEYIRLWIRLGMKNPKCYWDAYVALTKNYWFPDGSSWIWDIRIFDNSFGVERQAILLPERDLSYAMSVVTSFIPKFTLMNRSATILWLLIICLASSSVNESRIGMILCSPMLAIFAGLMLTSPVALFRYVYAVVACVPLLLCFPSTKNL